jgi:hypothetical protein
MMIRLSAGALLTAALVACKQEEPGQTPVLRICTVEWRGTLMTDSNEFNVRACWNGQCTSTMAVQAAQNDAGVPMPFRDAGCFPTTPGGPPSGCELVPITPPPGCTPGELGREFSVLSCARAEGDGITFGISLEATSEGFPHDGDGVALTIGTTAGNTLIDATATLSSNGLATDDGPSCTGGRFGLDGMPSG